MSTPGLRLGFAGTPPFAAVSLKALVNEGRHHIAAVYTQPDRPAGRGRRSRCSAVKDYALEAGLAVRQPATLREPAALDALRALGLDALVVVAYGQILPQAALDAPRLGCINVHASLLPRWRGAAPIQRAMLAGDTRTGVSIMAVTAQLDSGPVYRQAGCAIGETDTAASLEGRLAELGAAELLRTLQGLAAGSCPAVPQPVEGVCYAAKLSKAEGEIDWRRPAEDIARQVRAFNPRPVAWTRLLDLDMRIWECRAEPGTTPGAAPGTPLAAGPEGILVAAGGGAVRLTRVQLPGRRAVAAAELINAHPALQALRRHPGG